MKLFRNALLISFAILTAFSCKAEAPQSQNLQDQLSDGVHVYYFHNTKRCATCNAVEDETKVALEMFYGEKMKKGEIEFNSLNLEEVESKEMAKKFGVAGQTLLVVSGDIKVNLTNQGFMNARKNPSQFHDILKTEIDKLF